MHVIAKQTITQTTCPYCGVGCGVEVTKTCGKISLKGDASHPANKGRLCSKGSSLGLTLGLQNRLAQPEINQQEVSWDSALDYVASQLNHYRQRFGPDSILFYVSGQLLTEDYYVANKLMKGFIGSNNIDSNSRLCMSSAVAAYKRAFGSDTVPVCYDDIEACELFVMVGSNMAWCHPILFQRLKRAKQQGTKVVVIDPRKTDSCDIADLHLAIRPGSDSSLFNGLLHYLQSQGLLNAKQATKLEGLKRLEASCQSFSLQQVANDCQVEPEQLLAFYQLFASHEKVLSFYSMGVNQSANGTDKANSIINCHIYTGRLGKPGMGPFSITGQPNAMGGREVGALANLLASHFDLQNPEHRAQVAEFWQAPNAISGQPGVTAPEAAKAILNGNIKAIWIMATNPLVSLPDASIMRQALEKCPMVIVSDCVAKNDTLAYATVKLPALTWGEKDGTVTNSERCISRQRAFLPAFANARADWQIISDVATRMGFKGFDYKNSHQVFSEYAQLSLWHNQGQRSLYLGRLAKLNKTEYQQMQPVVWPVSDGGKTQQRRFFADGQSFHKDGKQHLLVSKAYEPVKACKHYPLLLNTGRLRDQWHTMTRTALAVKLNQHVPWPVLSLNTQDAKRQGIVDDDLLQVSSRFGMMRVFAKTDPQIKPGQAFFPMHWNKQFSAFANVGELIENRTDPISGQPAFKQTAIKVHVLAPALQVLVFTSRQLKDGESLLNWSKNQAEFGQQYRISLSQFCDIALLQQTLITLFGLAKGCQFASIQDPKQGHFRLVAFAPDNRLELVAYVGKHFAGLPGTSWVQQFFQANSVVEPPEVLALLASMPATGSEDVGPIVCSCFSVGQKTISQAITQKKLTTVEAITKCLKAGGNCGSCVPEIKQLLARDTYEKA